MSGIFAADCACRSAARRCGVMTCLTDDAAVKAAYAHWLLRAQDEYSEHRYWSVHGPSGHVIGIRGSPIGDLPPQPLTFDEATQMFGRLEGSLQ